MIIEIKSALVVELRCDATAAKARGTVFMTVVVIVSSVLAKCRATS